jgi:hypothetical protein
MRELRAGQGDSACDGVEGKDMLKCVCACCVLWYHNLYVNVHYPLPMLMVAAVCYCDVPLFFLRYA